VFDQKGGETNLPTLAGYTSANTEYFERGCARRKSGSVSSKDLVRSSITNVINLRLTRDNYNPFARVNSILVKSTCH